VHDRTVDGEALLFGNQGALFMNAMTWWDHKTSSIWSQPWGRALTGPLAGTELDLLPSQLVPWATWKAEHPNTLALDTERWRYRGERFQPHYVIGITLGDLSMAFPFDEAAEAVVTNDHMGPYPLLVHVQPETSSVHVYLRQVGEQTLTFVQQDGQVRDEESGSTWSMETGLAVEGPLQAQTLRSIPYIPAFRGSWLDFFPESGVFDGG
jgi:hypothetical protein